MNDLTDEYVNIFRSQVAEPEKLDKFFEHLQQGPRLLMVWYTGKMLGIKPKEFVWLVSELEPHLFLEKFNYIVQFNTDLEKL